MHSCFLASIKTDFQTTVLLKLPCPKLASILEKYPQHIIELLIYSAFW